MKCLKCEYFKRIKGNPHDNYYRPLGVCGIPASPKYVIDGENEKPPKWCLRREEN